jgi:hypothetical protein
MPITYSCVCFIKHQFLLAGERECERSALVNAVGTSVDILLPHPPSQTHILVYA